MGRSDRAVLAGEEPRRWRGRADGAATSTAMGGRSVKAPFAGPASASVRRRCGGPVLHPRSFAHLLVSPPPPQTASASHVGIARATGACYVPARCTPRMRPPSSQLWRQLPSAAAGHGCWGSAGRLDGGLVLERRPVKAGCNWRQRCIAAAGNSVTAGGAYPYGGGGAPLPEGVAQRHPLVSVSCRRHQERTASLTLLLVSSCSRASRIVGDFRHLTVVVFEI